MSWQLIKEMKEKRAKAFADAGSVRELARKESRDMTEDEQKRHDALFAEVENYTRKLTLEEKAAELSEKFDLRSEVGRGDQNSTGNMVGIPQKDYTKYSVLRAISLAIANKPLDGIEGEVNAEYEKRMGKRAQGFYFPSDLPLATRALNTTTGTGSVMTQTSSTLIDALRAQLLTGKVGATFLTDLQGKIALPRKSGVTTGYWVGEGNAVTASNPTLDQVLFAPKTVGGYTDITRQFAHQTSIDAENMVRNDLMTTIGLAVDVAAFNGSGLSNQPTGILNTSGIGDVAIAGQGARYRDVVALETAVAHANAMIDGACYATTPKARGLFKVLPRSSSAVGAGFTWADDNTMNGYRAFASNVIPSNLGGGTDLSAVIFGCFADLVIGMWGALDVIVDPFTGSSAGTVRIVALQDVDIQLRHAASFAAIKDMDTDIDDDPYVV